ncbi:MAG: GlmU family protein [Saprospiraceae bacterium]|uniref:GlmU family protein n=1 Tax=Candidatus Opimibacter skivensis TaxID=2982028 RepID=A0A9D7SRE8_9BACT|nr:GlmU family protein [Candidatus Opimibacter skivensis]
MRNIILFDDESREQMLPLSYTRPVAELRTGIFTIRERWEKLLNGTASYITSDYLSDRFPMILKDDNIVINGAVMPNDRLVRLIEQLEPNEALMNEGDLIAARLNRLQFENLFRDESIEEIIGLDLSDTPFIHLAYPWDLFLYLRATIEYDYDLVTKGRTSQSIPSHNQVLALDNIFVEEGAQVTCATLNAQSGPIYIGKNAQIMEGAVIRGPVTIGEGTIVKMGAKIYGPSAIGPDCRVGGEIKEVVILGHSNKAHDGYLGNSIIGEWCNLGAGTSVSNLKNNYSNVRMWDFNSQTMRDTGLQYLGTVMGDHSKAGIQTMFNTGTIVGVAANIFGEGYPPKVIPSFSWGGASGLTTHRLEDALETARKVISRREMNLTSEEEDILRHVFEITKTARPLE